MKIAFDSLDQQERFLKYICPSDLYCGLEDDRSTDDCITNVNTVRCHKCWESAGVEMEVRCKYV